MKRSPLAALALMLALACASCSDDDPEPKIAPPESSSPAPTERETTSAPPEPSLPALAAENTSSGAEAFVRHYWAMAEFAQASGDTSGLQRLANTRCNACTSGVSYLNDVFAKGGEIRGGVTTVSDLQSTPFSVGDSEGYEVTAKVHNTRQSVDFPEGIKDETYPAGTIETRFFVEWTGNGWLVALWEQT